MYDQHPCVPLPFVRNSSGACRNSAGLEQPLFQLLDATRVQEVSAIPVGFIGRKGAESCCFDRLSQTPAPGKEFDKEKLGAYPLLLNPT